MSDQSPRTLEQKRAAQAHALISKIKDTRPTNEAKNFGRQCLRLPALIHQCGLCQAIAFLEAKKFPEVVDSLAHIIGVSDPARKLDATALATQVREVGMMEYQWLTREAMKASQWLKRYSEAILKVKPGESADDRNAEGGE